MRCLVAFVVVFAVIIGGFIAYLYSGAFNVAATQDNPGWVDWIVVTARHNSIESRVDEVQVPDNLADPQMIAAGAHHYAAMCAVCHLAPGQDESETRVGLNPRPPRLPRIAQYIEPNEAFWIIKNGIRMTAMPAWGPTHSDAKLWQIVAFMKALPGMTAERYEALTAGADGMEEHGHHKHAEAPTSPFDINVPAPRTSAQPVTQH
ncbi:MAG TPA: cytochrome c [Gammaproteobacteria bacterium]|nr:cytochrome c [Gammaproteobacteria bacterium]